MLDWLKTVDDVSGWRGWTGVTYAARHLRRRMASGIMGFGATFFPSREALTRSRDFEEFLGTAENIDGIFIVGRTFIRNLRRRAREYKQ